MYLDEIGLDFFFSRFDCQLSAITTNQWVAVVLLQSCLLTVRKQRRRRRGRRRKKKLKKVGKGAGEEEVAKKTTRALTGCLLTNKVTQLSERYI